MWYICAMTQMTAEDLLEIEFDARFEHREEDLSWLDDDIEFDLQDDGE